jgi:DNA-binding LacI/PurR family transcriptional regulator
MAMSKRPARTQDVPIPIDVRARTITDIARLAGVSAGTVSRALSGSSLVKPRTSEKIRMLATAHGFSPNIAARNLRTRRTGAVGVIIPLGHEAGQHISDPFFMALLGHLADALTDRGYDLLLSRVLPSNKDWLAQFVDSGRVDGVIIIGQSNESAVLDEVASRYLPIVVWGGHIEGQVYCSVGSDNKLGGRLATEHLINKGCRRIAFFGDAAAPEIAQRLDGCREALTEAGIDATIDYLPVHLTAENAHPAILARLSENRIVPDGIVAASDVVGMSALRALSEFGLSVPSDVRVVGYDDLSIAAHTTPPLSSIKQDLATGAAHLVDILFRRMAGEATESVVMAPSLICRSST